MTTWLVPADPDDFGDTGDYYFGEAVYGDAPYGNSPLLPEVDPVTTGWLVPATPDTP